MKLKIALLLVLVAIGFHVYLSLHYYSIHFGQYLGDSICNVGSAFNCDSVSTSSFAQFLGIPMAVWGAATSGLLALILLLRVLGWVEDRPRWSQYTLGLAIFIASVSVIMGFISTFILKTYCLFCIFTYIISFIVLWLTWKTHEDGPSRLAFNKSHIVLLALIPVSAFFFHKSYVSKMGGRDLDVALRSALAEWSQATPISLATTAPTLKKGPANPKMTISEFADFRCIHCKNASTALSAFFKTRPDVAVEFFAFPLDGTCNPELSGGDGVSCYLSKVTYCAEKIHSKGWEAHDTIFAAQESLVRVGTIEAAKNLLNDLMGSASIQLSELTSCIEDESTHQSILAQAKLGKEVGVRGTPTLFINGRKLSQGRLLPTLNYIYNNGFK
jgi:protein-disulfide isomerase/uncharacterized membrane protein